MKKSENPNAFFPNKGRCETLQAVPRSQPAIRFNCTAGTGSEILNTNHMFPNVNPVGTFTSPRPLYVRSQNYFNRCTYTYGFRVAYTPVFFVRACAWLSAPENSTENHFVVLRELRKRKRNECSLKLFFSPWQRGIHDP